MTNFLSLKEMFLISLQGNPILGVILLKTMQKQKNDEQVLLVLIMIGTPTYATNALSQQFLSFLSFFLIFVNDRRQNT